MKIMTRKIAKPLLKIFTPIRVKTLKRRTEFDKTHTLMMLSTLDWNYPFHQRPHHLARALAHAGIEVLFVSPMSGHDPIFGVRRVGARLTLVPGFDTARALAPNATVCVLSTDTRSLPRVVREARARGTRILYDFLDHLDETLSNGPLNADFRSAHREVLGNEDLAYVIASADKLLEEIQRHRHDGYALVTNGVDVDHFRYWAQASSQSAPARARMIGYYGALAGWLDTNLVAAVARLRPNYRFILMGPVFLTDPACFDGMPENVEVRPPVPYDDLPRETAQFDVLTIPFRVNDVTQATSPLKLFEYMALGRPIVTTRILECLKYEVVLTAEGPEEFAAQLDHALDQKITKNT
jgi:glycosyltransferase involved in cell wall biosynthesis